MISFDDFKKVEIRVGKVLTAEKILDATKLLCLTVDMAEEKPRQIVSGIAPHFPDPSVLVGKSYMFVANIEPRIIHGFESQGMVLAVSTSDGIFSLLGPSCEIPAGTMAQ